MSDHVLLNLLIEMWEGDKMLGLPNVLSLFRNEFNIFNNILARMLDSRYHMKLYITMKMRFGHGNVKILSILTQRCYGRHYIALLNM